MDSGGECRRRWLELERWWHRSSGGDAGSDSARGGEGGEPRRDLGRAPVVVFVSSEDEAGDIEPDAEIEIEFSRRSTPRPSPPSSIVVRDGDRIVGSELDFSGTSRRLHADESLTLLANLSVTVTTGVTDLEGTELEEEFVSSFQVREDHQGHQLEFNYADQGIQPGVRAGAALDAWRRSMPASQSRCWRMPAKSRP